MRNISFSFTTGQVKARIKTVTRRQGWIFLKSGVLLGAIEKGRGLPRGEKVRRIGVIRIVDVRQEPLDRLLSELSYGQKEVALEGFPDLSPADFVAIYCRNHRGSSPADTVTRIQFEYMSPSDHSLQGPALNLFRIFGPETPRRVHELAAVFLQNAHRKGTTQTNFPLQIRRSFGTIFVALHI